MNPTVLLQTGFREGIGCAFKMYLSLVRKRTTPCAAEALLVWSVKLVQSVDRTVMKRLSETALGVAFVAALVIRKSTKVATDHTLLD